MTHAAVLAPPGVFRLGPEPCNSNSPAVLLHSAAVLTAPSQRLSAASTETTAAAAPGGPLQHLGAWREEGQGRNAWEEGGGGPSVLSLHCELLQPYSRKPLHQPLVF